MIGEIPDLLSDEFANDPYPTYRIRCGTPAAQMIVRQAAADVTLDAMPDVRPADGFTPVRRGTFSRGPATLDLRFTPAP